MRARLIQLSAMKAREFSALKRAAEADGAYRVARRLHAILLSHQEHTSGEIARLLDAPRSRVSLWLQQYATHGWEALLEGHRSGRPKELSEAQRRRLDDLLDSGPVAYGFTSGVWTSPMIARVIAEEFAVHYHPGHVRKVLKSMGFSVQRPRRQLVRADPVAQDRWQRYTYPRLKKNGGSARGTAVCRGSQLPAGSQLIPNVVPPRSPATDSDDGTTEYAKDLRSGRFVSPQVLLRSR
jgi:transposase